MSKKKVLWELVETMGPGDEVVRLSSYDHRTLNGTAVMMIEVGCKVRIRSRVEGENGE